MAETYPFRRLRLKSGSLIRPGFGLGAEGGAEGGVEGELPTA